MKKNVVSLLIALVAIAASCYAGQPQSLTVYFEKDKAVLTATEAVKLQALARADLAYIKGYTDNDGSEAYNMSLSARRVLAVKDFIKQQNTAINTECGYYGEANALNNNADDIEKQKNRRVEVLYFSDPLLRIKTPVQFYEVDGRKANTISCREGTKVEIPEGAFAGKVLIKVSEYYNAASIFSANLSTRCNGAPIESAGMLYVSAEVNGQSVNPTKPLSFKFPKRNTNKDFRVFQGERQPDFQMNWNTGKKPEVTAIAEDTDYRYIDYLSTPFYTATVNGAIEDQLFQFWNNLSEKKSYQDYLLNGCIENAVVDIDINMDGRVTSVKTNYTDKSTECDRPLQLYIQRNLPARFKPLTSNSHINIAFHKYEPENEILDVRVVKQPLIPKNEPPVNRQNGYFPFGNEFSADYETDFIVLKSANMGWINCDRFLQNPMVDYSVQTDTSANVRILLKKYKSFFLNEYWNSDYNATMQAKNEGRYIFRKVPANEEILIVSTKKVNGKIMLAIESSNTGKGGVFKNLVYNEVTQQQLESAMKDLKI